MLVKTNSQIPTSLLNPLSSRLLDHVNILAVIEADILSMTKPGAEPTWTIFPENKLKLKNNTETVVSSILRLHNILISQHTRMGTLGSNPDLFWTSAS
jgi:hypothetical protein